MRLFPVLLLLAAALVAMPVRAATVLAGPVEEMSRKAGTVVRGVVEKQSVGWSDDKRNLETRTTIRVTSHLKGKPTGERVVVTQMGGALDGLVQTVPGDARFQAGQEVVLFLESRPRARGEFVLTALAAAKFTVVRDATGPIAIRDLAGLSFAARGPDGRIRPLDEAPSSRFALADLLRRIADAK